MAKTFKHYYAIVDGGCWYVGFHLNKEDAERQAINTCNVHHSKVGYIIANSHCLKLISNDLNDIILKDPAFKDGKV